MWQLRWLAAIAAFATLMPTYLATSDCTATESCTSETRSNSLLQTRSVRGQLRADGKSDDEQLEDDIEDIVKDEDMQSRSAAHTVHSHLQQGKADVQYSSASAVASQRTYKAYSSYLRRAVDVLEASRNASNSELNNLIDSFIAAHTGPTDHCPAELMEAKHQLNSLHKTITDMAEHVKSIESEIQQNELKNATANDELKKLTQTLDDANSNNADAKEAARQFLATLKGEMAVMRKIAQPDVTMNITAKTVKTDGGVLSLLELPDANTSERHAKDAQAMVEETKAASSDLLTCLQEETAAMPENKNRALLAQVSATVVEQRRVASHKAMAGMLASPNCSVNQSTPVTVGSTTMNLLSPADIANETYRSYHCSHVNSSFGGTIWLHCVDGVLSADARGCIRFPSTQQCQSQREALEETYVKAYVGLGRLISEYERTVADTGPEEAAQKQHDDNSAPYKTQTEEASDDIVKKMKELQDLRSKLDDAWNAETKLQTHITNLGTECQSLGDTTKYLEDVKDAIHALEACPGLERAEFKIPLMAGYANFTLDPTKTDAETDVLMTQACQASFGVTSRAAEVSEIEGHSVEGSPANNTAVLPLLGTCPDCVCTGSTCLFSDTGSTAVSGHARVCWQHGKPLELAHRQPEGCWQKWKAIMCVSDRGDVRKLAGFATMPPTTAPTNASQ